MIEDSRNFPQREELEQELLAVRCQLGEPEAFEELVALLHRRLWSYLISVVGERAAAEDVLQETWLRVVRDISRLREPARLISWIFGIARHIAFDSLRRRRILVDLAEAEDLLLALAEENASAAFDASALLDEEIFALPLIEREVLTLYYLDELSLRQVAEIVGVPEGTVKSRLFRARKHLLERLEAKGKDLWRTS